MQETEIELMWNEAEIVPAAGLARARFVLTVPLSGVPGARWRHCFQLRAERARHEVRGGSWGDVALRGDDVVEVRGVGEGSQEPLQAYLDALVRGATEDAHRDLERERAQLEARRERRERAAAAAAEMTAQLRAAATRSPRAS